MPIDLRIESIAPGTCTWCGKEKDTVVSFSFADRSFIGTMCWNDLKRALTMKAGANGERRSAPALAVAAVAD